VSGVDPVYSSRRQRAALGTINIAIGLVVWSYSRLLGRFFLAVGGAMLFSAVIHRRRRIV
jgi:hypothetical protein